MGSEKPMHWLHGLISISMWAVMPQSTIIETILPQMIGRLTMTSVTKFGPPHKARRTFCCPANLFILSCVMLTMQFVSLMTGIKQPEQEESFFFPHLSAILSVPRKPSDPKLRKSNNSKKQHKEPHARRSHTSRWGGLSRPAMLEDLIKAHSMPDFTHRSDLSMHRSM